MAQDIVNKQEFFRLTSTKWSGINSRNRWALMCAMHDRGESWAVMGRQINRHWTTAKRLWKRGMLERQKMAAVQGIAPRPTAPKAGVLLLHQTAKVVPRHGNAPCSAD